MTSLILILIDQWKHLVEKLLLQCDNHTTCIDIISMVIDDTNDTNDDTNDNNTENNNLHRY